MFDLIQHPVLTEKSVRLVESQNQFTFNVDPRLTKPQIRALVESLFGVKVLAVNTHRPPRQHRRLGAFVGEKPRYKRAIVTLPKDQKIQFLPKSHGSPFLSSSDSWNPPRGDHVL
jgi:large subunit ribosomal protein L23